MRQEFTPDALQLMRKMAEQFRSKIDIGNIELSIRKNCIFCFNQILKRSKEHPITQSIGGKKLIFPLICGKCNNNLGSIVDSHWTWDCWMKFAKDQLNLPEFNFKSDLKVSDSQNRYTVIKLPNGEEQDKPPFTPDGAWRAVGKMAYELCAMTIGNCIFHNDFDWVRDFIIMGKLPAGHKSDSGSLHFGEWCNIVRIAYNEKPAPWHIFDFQDSGECLSIGLALFNYYSFFATFKVNIKELGLKTVEFPFRIVQELRPENKLYFCSWDNEQNKWKTIGCF